MNILETIGGLIYFIAPFAGIFYVTSVFDTNFSKAIGCFILIGIYMGVTKYLLCDGLHIYGNERCEELIFAMAMFYVPIIGFTGIFYIILGLISGKGS